MRIGIDIGGTTVKIGFCENLELLLSYEVKTTKETLFDDVAKSILERLNGDLSSVEFIGVGVPGTVKDNYIYNLPNIGIKDVNVADEFSKYFKGVKIGSTNDANAAALAECLVDDEDTKSAYMVTLGTGVGGGYVYNKRVIDGTHAACGEIGHIFIDPVHMFECGCGNKGCLETVSSATGIVRLAKTYFNDYKTKLNYETLTAKDVIDAAKENDELGLYVLNTFTKYLGIALANIAVTVDVEAFYIGGGVSNGGDILIEYITKYYKEYAHYAVKNTKIKLAKLKNTAGIIGAAYLA